MTRMQHLLQDEMGINWSWTVLLPSSSSVSGEELASQFWMALAICRKRIMISFLSGGAGKIPG